MTTRDGALLARILDGSTEVFALLHRPEAAGEDVLDVLTGEVTEVATIAGLELDGAPRAGAHQELLVLIPYRQLAERGFAAPDDGRPLLAMRVDEQAALSLRDTLGLLPNHPVKVTGEHFDIDDDAYAETVRRVVADEIGTGEGANFVMRRSFVAQLPDFGLPDALSFFRRLVEREAGAYWTFLIRTGGRTFVGATPERHISVRDGRAVMNPVSGTYRYPVSGPDLDGVLAFLADTKEADELYMVVDEELKMMGRICPGGGRVRGPYLKEMARLAHTEYIIEGRTDRDVRDILRETLFAPTVTGSPLESAARVISRYEPAGRGYYSGVAALIGRDAAGGRTLDSSILIRTADIDPAGVMRIGVGATLVRHSDPHSEVQETRAKAAGLLAALGGAEPTRFGAHPAVREALDARNEGIARFWLQDAAGPAPAAAPPVGPLAGRRVLVVDAEDTFTEMIAHQIRSLGCEVDVRRFDEPYDFDGHDLVVMGPGPGDPREAAHPKIAHLRSAAARLLDERRPFLAVCLSHQVLSTLLGLDLVRREVPNQGAQHEIDLFGEPARVGFYNTYAARCATDSFEHPVHGRVEVSRNAATGEVHALRAAGFASMQFHAESVLTVAGPDIIGSLLREVAGPCTR
ncbi:MULTISPECIES: phenazine-specific anthranilate synthase component I [Kitasatospora]|uniref:anthranilate synthase n=1 Tax=Kitasatospora setae (strain ATCC 33774 / DSM 43861 / JCM 3304 / KCC A-0304 / NBRC 14216 / KM-6054) TaxID=452652 RepID=E4N3W9_KITSK|nr:MULTISPECIES: phenazine-specific anthranilate synthase component I [Kitasatospora]BAJ31600.1 putative peptidase C26 family protein [Kitasatospora setae KM-6054]